MKVPETHLLYKEIEGDKRLAVSYSQIDTFQTYNFTRLALSLTMSAKRGGFRTSYKLFCV